MRFRLEVVTHSFDNYRTALTVYVIRTVKLACQLCCLRNGMRV